MSFNQNYVSSPRTTARLFSSLWFNHLKYFLKSPVLVSILIAIITLLAFSRVISSDFVMWDDDLVLYKNPNIGSLSLARLRWVFTDIDSMMAYNPLTLLNWCITYHFFGLEPFWYHLNNWLFHGANAVLLFVLLRKLLVLGLSRAGLSDVESFRITLSAAVGTLLWSLHPLRVEPVAWVTDLPYCQSLFFLFLTLLFYLRANEGRVTITGYRINLGASLLCYVLSLLTYGLGISFFVLLIVLDVYLFGRLGGRSGWRTVAARRAILEKLPFVVAAMIFALIDAGIRMVSAGSWEKPVSLLEFGFLERLMQAMYVWAYYIWRPWYPFNLSPVYTTLVSFEPFSLPFVASALLVVGGFVVLVLLRRKWPLGLALGICHLVLLVPLLGALEHPHYHSDRYSIIVSISWSIIIAALLVSRKISNLYHKLIIIFLSLAIAFLGLLTFQQTGVWDNSVTLFEHTLDELDNDHYIYDIHWRLGVVLIQQGKTDEAIEHFQKSLQVNPGFAEAHNSLAKALAIQGNLVEAVIHFRKAIEINPSFAEAHFNLGNALRLQGKLRKATTQYLQALQFEPENVEVHNNLGAVLKLQGKFDEAIGHYRKALEIAPDYFKAYNNLGSVYLAQGRLKKSISHFRRALNIKPDYVTALGNLERILGLPSNKGLLSGMELMRYAERAVELTGYKNARALKTLAACYAFEGRFEEAIKTVNIALKIASSKGDKGLTKIIRKRLRKYKKGKS